ncbi:Formyl-CoA:oxalate CoA-transferase [compost metagenome]
MAAGVPAAPIRGVAQGARTPHAAHRAMVLEQDGYHGVGFPIKLRRTPASLRTLPPLPGQHNQEILRAAGYSESDIARLLETGALGPVQDAPRPP